MDRPRDWTACVNEIMPGQAIDDLHTSVNRGRPYGESRWVERTAKRLGLDFTLRNPGRPRKDEKNQ